MMTPAIFNYEAQTASSNFEKLVDLLPKIMALPGGIFFANYLLFRSVRLVRGSLNLVKSIPQEPGFPTAGTELHRQYAEMVAAAATEYRKVSAPLFSMETTNPITRFLRARLDKTINEYSDLAETWALGIDPEMHELAAGLNNVL